MNASGALSRTPDNAEIRLAPVSALLQRICDSTADEFTLNTVMAAMPQQSFGMLLLLMALLGAAPVVSFIGGLLLVMLSVQMICGCSQPSFPAWIADGHVTKRHLQPVLRRAIPPMKWLETIVHPRLMMPANLAKPLVGGITLVLSVRLLLTPIPTSNIPPALLIALISLAYLEQDGVLLFGSLFAACVLLGIEFGIVSHLGQAGDWFVSLLH